LKGLPQPIHLFLYQSYPELEALASEENWTLLANRSVFAPKQGPGRFSTCCSTV